MATRTPLGDFLNLIKKSNIARPNRFKITFTLPSALSSGSTSSSPSNPGADYMKMNSIFNQQLTSQINDVNNAISLTCMMVDIPSRQEVVSEITYGNYSRKIASGRSYSDVNMTFLVTGGYGEKKLFDAWHNIILDESNTAVQFYDDYISTVTIECLDSQDNAQYVYILEEAWPTSIGSIRMDRTSQNQQMVLDVTWGFHRITYGDDQRGAQGGIAGNGIPPVAIPGVGSGKNRLLPIPGIDQMSSAVQTAVDTIKEFKGQLDGALNVARDVREQVRDLKMTAIDGVKTINGVVKDFKALNHVPTDVRNEVVAVLNDTKNQLGSLQTDTKNFRNYPTR